MWGEKRGGQSFEMSHKEKKLNEKRGNERAVIHEKKGDDRVFSCEEQIEGGRKGNSCYITERKNESVSSRVQHVPLQREERETGLDFSSAERGCQIGPMDRPENKREGAEGTVDKEERGATFDLWSLLTGKMEERGRRRGSVWRPRKREGEKNKGETYLEE